MYAMPATIMWSGVRSIARRVLGSPIEERLTQSIREVCQEHQADIEQQKYV